MGYPTFLVVAFTPNKAVLEDYDKLESGLPDLQPHVLLLGQCLSARCKFLLFLVLQWLTAVIRLLTVKSDVTDLESIGLFFIYNNRVL